MNTHSYTCKLVGMAGGAPKSAMVSSGVRAGWEVLPIGVSSAQLAG